ncbi:hypothetical protein [Cellulomonas sp. URHB0016]
MATQWQPKESDRQPVEGQALIVVAPAFEVTTWWGEDDNEADVVAVAAGRVLTWATPEQCLTTVESWGWLVEPALEPVRLDVRPVADWVCRRRTTLDFHAALDTWNLATDVARSVCVAWGDRGVLADACYDKLLVANVPWLVGRDHYTPRWSVAQERYLRRRLASALSLLRAQLGPVPGRLPQPA